MKVDKALRNVMRVGGISIYRLAIQAEMDRGKLGKIVKGTHGTAWDVVEKIAKGLETIEPCLRGAFLYNLSLPQDAFADTPTDQILEFPKLTPEHGDRIVAVLEKIGGMEGLKDRAKQLGGRYSLGELLAATVEGFEREVNQIVEELEPDD